MFPPQATFGRRGTASFDRHCTEYNNRGGPCCVCFRVAPQKLRKLQRPHAGGRWEPNSFNPLLWGQNMLKRFDKENQPPCVEAEPHNAETSCHESTELLDGPSESDCTRPHPEVDDADEALSAELESRRQSFRHLVFCGRDITMEYPAPETPTWEEWQEAIQASSVATNTQKEWQKMLEDAIKVEDYGTAAELKRDLDNLAARDVVDNFIQDYKLAIHEENFNKAAELLEGCSIDLCGWWSVNTPTAENGHHILRISKAYDSYRFDAFTPEELANMHGISDTGLDTEPSPPSAEDYAGKGVTVAELHFQRFPNSQEASGERIYTLATATRAEQPESLSPLIVAGDDGELITSTDGGEDHLRLLLKLTKSVMRKEARSGASLGRGIDLLLPRPDNASAQPSGDMSEQDGQAADAGRSSEDDAQDVSQSLLSGIQSMKARPEKQRVPLNLLRTEKDRIMLVVAPLPGKEAAGSRGQDDQASNSSQQSSNDEPTSGSVVHMSSASSTEEIVAKLKYVIRTRPRNQSATEKSSLFDKAEENLERRMKDEEAESEDVPTEKGERMLMHLAKHVKAAIQARLNQNISKTGLKGAIGYSRINTPSTSTDPFSGLFIGMFGPHGPEVLQVQRVMGQDGKEFVEGVKITGDANVPAGRVSFKACISSDSKMPSTRYLPPELGIRARYKGQGQVAEVGFKNPRWVDGELWQLGSTNAFGFPAPVEIAFLYTMGENKVLTPLQRIHLDDPLGSLTR